MSYFRVNNRCNGCLACVENCPADALRAADTKGQRTLLHHLLRCARCGNCWRVCPQDAIEFEHLLKGEWSEVVTLDLVRCRICGEALYTAPYRQTVSEKLGQETDSVCLRHRESVDALARATYLPAEKDKDEVLP